MSHFPRSREKRKALSEMSANVKVTVKPKGKQGRRRGAKPKNKGSARSDNSRRSNSARTRAPRPAVKVIVKENQHQRSSRSRTAMTVRSKVALKATGVNGLGQFMDPLNYEPIRLPDILSASSVGTASAVLSEVLQYSWPTTAPIPSQWPIVYDQPAAGTTNLVDNVEHRLFIVTRDPVVSAIYMNPAPYNGAVPSTYLGGVVNSVTILPWGTDPVLIVRNGPDTELDIDGMILVSGQDRYGGYTPAGTDGGRKFVWLDGTPANPCTVTFGGVVSLGGTNIGYVGKSVTLICYVHTSAGERSEIYRTSAALPARGTLFNTGNISIQVSGYFSFAVNVVGVDAIDGELVVQTPTMWYYPTAVWTMKHQVHPDLLSAGAIVENVRILGSTMLISNSTAEFFKSGTVYARQMDQEELWFADTGKPESFSTANVQLNYDGPLSKGIYAVVKPQGQGALSLVPTVVRPGPRSTTDASIQLNYRPFAFAGAVAILLCPTTPYAATNSSQANMTIHTIRGMEYTTNSQLVKIQRTALSRAEYDQILDGLSVMNQFYENPLHLRDIKSAIARAGNWLWGNRSAIGGIAAGIAARNPAMAFGSAARLSYE